MRSALERRYLATHTRGEVEKIMQVQAKYLWIYALFYREFGDVRYRRAAEAIHRYARTFGARPSFRRPDGAFYVSQDTDVVKGQHADAYSALDDAGRRRQGIPAVDRHLYARENRLDDRRARQRFTPPP